MPDAAIEVEGLRTFYADVERVHGIGFTVGVGEIFGLLGTNGAGKTTTTVGNLTAAEAGEARNDRR